MNYDLNQIKAIPIESIASKYININKYKIINKGKLFVDCPFCNHKNHFIIYNDNVYDSFNACAKRGSVIDFIMNVEHMTAIEAIQLLAKDYSQQEIKISSSAKRERYILSQISQFEDRRIKQEVNRLFDFLKFMGYEQEFLHCLSAGSETEILQYSYYLKGIGKYL